MGVFALERKQCSGEIKCPNQRGWGVRQHFFHQQMFWKTFLREGIKRVLPNLKHAINVNNHLCLKVYLDYNFSFSAAIFSFSPKNEPFRMSNSPKLNCICFSIAGE